MSGALSCGCDPDLKPLGWVCQVHQAGAIEWRGEEIDAGEEYTVSLVDATIDEWDSSFPGEVRVTDPLTGGQKGAKLQRFSLIPSEFLWALAEHFGVGARKYADRNWEKGYNWSLCADALDRHWHLWRMGESRDPETGTNHLICVAWHACALFIFELRGLGTDDLERKGR